MGHRFPPEPEGSALLTDVSAIVCAYADQPHLADVVASLRASRDVSVEIIVVDNGSPQATGLTGVRVLRPGFNTGFAGGCNLGAREATGETLVFVNSDATVDPDCLAALHVRAEGLISATVLLADEPDRVNSWGNPVHLLGFSWAGGYGHPVAEARSGPVASVSGAVFAIRRTTFLALGGLDERYFAYGEDVDISLRATMAGLPVESTTAALAWHHYDFSRNPAKLYLLERNRLITVLTTYEARTLLALTPLLLAAEAALALQAGRDGWLRQKVAGWRWLLGHRRELRHRRNRVQGSRRIADDQLLPRMTAELNPPTRFGMAIPEVYQRMIVQYWRRIGSRVAGG